MLVGFFWSTAAGETVFPLHPAGKQYAPASPVREPMQLVLSDEFDGTALDPAVWESQAYTSGLSKETARGPGNLEVIDGELRLHIRKEERDIGRGRKSKWTAGFVYTREPVPNNVYIESRFKASASSGVNNAFWLSSVTAERSRWKDRYEIDIVEARRGTNPLIGKAHLAWHDWKTYAYATNAAGKSDHVAQGESVDHAWNEYHTWGLWYGENEFIYYLDGQEVWSGTTHEKYHEQWKTGVGKFKQWFKDEEQRAYGRFGQALWRYYGGYAGDRMNVVFSTLPWAEKWAPLTDDAHGTWMAVDYIRIFRPVRLLAQHPLQQAGARELADHRAVQLSHPVNLKDDAPVYMAVRFARQAGSSLQLELLSPDAAPVGSVTVAADGTLELTLGSGTASLKTSWPACESNKLFETETAGRVLILRITPNQDDTAPLLSACLFYETALPADEPYLYHNADSRGNTSRNQGWDLACKSVATGTVSAVQIKTTGAITLGDLRIGTSFQSVAHSIFTLIREREQDGTAAGL
jgi:hypothetical protein